MAIVAPGVVFAMKNGIPEYDDIIVLDTADWKPYEVIFAPYIGQNILMMVKGGWLDFYYVGNGCSPSQPVRSYNGAGHSIWTIHFGEYYLIANRKVNKEQFFDFIRSNYPAHFDMFLFHPELLG